MPTDVIIIDDIPEPLTPERLREVSDRLEAAVEYRTFSVWQGPWHPAHPFDVLIDKPVG